jgi:diguanylate cyclase (GGDEF)-like protein
VDNFKEINDSLSHVEGDRALQNDRPDLLMEQSRASDVPCRYGGDEFVVLLPATETSSAAGVAARLQETLLDRCRNATPPYPWGTISTTIGVASYPSDSDVATPSDMIAWPISACTKASGRTRSHRQRGRPAPSPTRNDIIHVISCVISDDGFGGVEQEAPCET